MRQHPVGLINVCISIGVVPSYLDLHVERCRDDYSDTVFAWTMILGRVIHVVVHFSLHRSSLLVYSGSRLSTMLIACVITDL